VFYKPEKRVPEWPCRKCGRVFKRTEYGIANAIYTCLKCRQEQCRRPAPPPTDRVSSVFEFRGCIRLDK